MNIAMITSSLSSGVRTHLRQLCNYLVEIGHEVTVVYSERSDTNETELMLDFNSEISFVKIQVSREIDLRRDFLVIAEYRKILRNIKPNVVHFHSSKAGALGRLASLGVLSKSTKKFYTPHGYSFLRTDVRIYNRIAFWIIEFFLAKLSETIVVSESEKRLAKRLCLKHSKIHLIPNSVEIANGFETRSLYSQCIATSGRITFQKNPAAFVKIAKHARSQDSNIKFLWIGGGTFEDEYAFKQMLDSEGLNDIVSFTGWLSHESSIRLLKSKVDIYLHTAHWEGLSYSLLEAMSLGIPCVVSDIPANREVIKSGVNGYLASNINEYVDRLLEIVRNRHVYKRLGESAFRTIKERHSLDKMLGEYSKLISS